MYIISPPRGRNLYAPPLLYAPHGIFRDGGGIKFGPIKFTFLGGRFGHYYYYFCWGGGKGGGVRGGGQEGSV